MKSTILPDEKQRPEWAPPEGGEGFATHVMKGVEASHDGLPSAERGLALPTDRPRRRHLSVDDHVQGVLAGDRTILGRTITLVESNAPAHMDMAQDVLRQLLSHTGRSIRVGITGVPGVGKSTFIEALGMHLIKAGRRVAVLAVDPSSSLTKGSILGDKTRMELLSRELDCFIRPSPSGGTLGGVARKSRETILVCEAAGFDVILVETVGVGQSETVVRSMVDFFLLLMLAGAGDELQGIKKGIMELADALLINKADGDNLAKARLAKAEYTRALHYLAPATEGWRTKAYICSALSGMGIAEIWNVVEGFHEKTVVSGAFEKRRRSQAWEWVYTMVEEHLRNCFFNHPGVMTILPEIKAGVEHGALPPTIAVKKLVSKFESCQD
jgi:LAO/AO transport system kinase